MFSEATHQEQIERSGGLIVDINGDARYYKDATLETLKANEARCRFNNKKLTVEVGGDPQ